MYDVEELWRMTSDISLELSYACMPTRDLHMNPRYAHTCTNIHHTCTAPPPHTHIEKERQQTIEQDCLKSKTEKEKIAKMIEVHIEREQLSNAPRRSTVPSAIEVTNDEDCKMLVELVVRNHVLISAPAPQCDACWTFVRKLSRNG